MAITEPRKKPAPLAQPPAAPAGPPLPPPAPSGVGPRLHGGPGDGHAIAGASVATLLAQHDHLSEAPADESLRQRARRDHARAAVEAELRHRCDADYRRSSFVPMDGPCALVSVGAAQLEVLTDQRRFLVDRVARQGAGEIATWAEQLAEVEREIARRAEFDPHA
jgi:hypothetical protein